MTNESLLLKDVSAALTAEMSAVTAYVNSWNVDPAIMLMEVVRFLDGHMLRRHIHGECKSVDEAKDDLFLRLGFNPALAMLLPRVAKERGFPLTPATRASLNIAGTLLHHLGAIRFVQRCIDLNRSGAFRVEREGKVIRFLRCQPDAGAEVFERFDQRWFSQHLENFPVSIPSEIRNEMSSLVYRFREHFIGYDTSFSIDDHFLRIAMIEIEQQRAVAGLHPNFRFESFTGREIGTTSALLISLFTKHLFFCIELLKKNDDLIPENVFTILTERDDLARAISGFAQTLMEVIPAGERHLINLNRRNAFHCLQAFSLRDVNVHHHCRSFQTSLPPLIAVGRNCWIRPLASLIGGPLESVREHHFGLHNFRSMRRIDASLRKASALRLRHSQSLASLRHLPSHAKVRSTIQRLGSTTKAFS